MVISGLWLELSGSWDSFVGGWEIGARSCAHCKGAAAKMATVAVASLCIKVPLHGDRKRIAPSEHGANDDCRTATAFPSKILEGCINSLQTHRGCADSMQYGRKKTAAISGLQGVPYRGGAFNHENFAASEIGAIVLS
jgi:hypothetical protein